jgi:hypothetical protein
MTEWLDTVPVTDRAKIDAAFKLENEAMKRRMKRPYIPAGCDQQGRFAQGFADSRLPGDGEAAPLGLALLALSAVAVISLLASLL